MDRILKSFLKRLTNISSSNRSVCLLKLYHEQFFDLHRLDFLYKISSFQLISQLIAGKKKIILCDELDSRNETINEISKNIRKIARREKLLFEETGACDLYVGWPYVEGKLSDGSAVRCPLLFFPVTLVLENAKWSIQQREGVEITLNKNFLLAYSHFNGVSIGDEWIESSFEDFDKDATAFRTALYELMKNSPVELNFNQELFVDKLETFREYKTEEYNALHKNGELKLHQEAVLGIFPQAGSYLVPDYEALISKNEYSGIEDFLNSKTLNLDSSIVKEENNYLTFQTNASQEEALIKVKEGKSLVVQGPPGTGKSQLICNLISDFTARGKKVLLVCQKKAALDVVYERLKTKNVHVFSALVHDIRNDRAKIMEQIGKQIGEVENNQKQNNGLDTIYLERTFTQASRQIKHSQEELDSFKEALFSTIDFGISAKELYLTSSPHAAKIPLKDFASRFNLENSVNFERKVKNFMSYASLFMKDDYFWKSRISFEDFYQRDQQAISETLLKIPVYQKQLQGSASRQIKSAISDYSLHFFTENKDAALQINSLIKEEDEYFLLLELLDEKVDIAWLEERKRKILMCFGKEMPETFLATEDLEDCEEKINHYLEVKKNFAKTLYWNFFSTDKAYVKAILTKNKLSISLVGVNKLQSRILSRKKFEKERNALLKKSWTTSFPKNINKEEAIEWFEMFARVHKAKELIVASGELRMLTDYSENDYKVFNENFQFISLLADDVHLNHQQWSKYLAPEMIHKILSQEYKVSALQETLAEDFDKLIAFDKLQKEQLGYEAQIMQSLVNDETTFSEEEKLQLFRNSIRLQWLEILEEKYPILLSVSNLKMDQLERTLQESISDKRKVSCDILQLRLREGSYKNIEYNRLQNRVTYRDLFHQVTKKKRLWPLRKLISEFSEEIFDLLPCWMVSPESASALFPLKDMFDLVIFDEASQCFAEQGLPAMYRGRQVVIAGDSKQLKPNDLYQARWEDESEDIADLEIDSLLDLSTKYLPSVRLTGHYRSRNLDLIDFSNRHFYNQSLELIPYFSELNKLEPSIKYIPVQGLWENNTNPDEAKSVVNLVIDLLKKADGKSIGIVTFNFKQAQLITDLLEEKTAAQKILIPESLFVKNIENVQGDEKDIIIFSIGYAPDSRGRFNMKFGSLNQEGGANRLNVAVTRAKDKIYLVASIFPQQLLVEDSTHEGPKLLKKYLEYAWQVSEGLYKPSALVLNRQNRDWYLSKKILQSKTNSTLKYSEELPFADITVKNAEKYYALILTDDDLYFNARNSKEPHAYKQAELKEKGWMCMRFFSREYWLQKNASLPIISPDL